MVAGAIVARGLTKRYGDLVAVDGLDLEVERGTCVGLLGPNGAGKTTTIEMLEGLREPDGGEIRILDRTWKHDGDAIRERIGVSLQETKLTEKLTVLETLRLFRSFYGRGRAVDEVIDLIGLPSKRSTRVGELSGGQQQRLALGCALVHYPELLFLDEPTTGLDPQARRRVWEIVESFVDGGGTVLLTTHYMEEAARLANRVVIVDRGRVIANGSPDELVDSLGVESLVELDLGDAALEPAGLEGLPGVQRVRLENGTASLDVRDVSTAVPAVLDRVRSAGGTVADLRIHRPTLEDVFVSLTGRHLRDG